MTAFINAVLGTFPNCPFAALSGNLFAYLDPGTGSFIIQMLIAGFLGILFAVKLFWHRIKAFLVNLFSKGEKNQQDGE